MRILKKIDKEIISKFLPNEEMNFFKGDEKKLMRTYKSHNAEISLIIFERLNDIGVSTLLPGILLNPHFHVAITRYKEMVLVFVSRNRPINIVLKEVPKLDDDDDCDEDYNDEEEDDDKPYAYTNGRWSPCPYCGSRKISTFMDGTAQCDDCKREFRYLQK